MTTTVNATAITFNDATVQTTAYTGATSPFPAGTAMIFKQTAAPTGWTKVLTDDNSGLRVVTGTASTGGTVGFTTAFASQAVSGTNSLGAVTATTLSTAQLASHGHSIDGSFLRPSDSGYIPGDSGPYNGNPQGASANANGSGASHTHSFTQPTFTGTAINLAVKYVDVIVATKN
jgi:hypothetical protein